MVVMHRHHLYNGNLYLARHRLYTGDIIVELDFPFCV